MLYLRLPPVVVAVVVVVLGELEVARERGMGKLAVAVGDSMLWAASAVGGSMLWAASVGNRLWRASGLLQASALLQEQHLASRP